MKNSKLVQVFTAAVLLATAVSSCSKEEESSPASVLGSSTITGVAKADLILGNGVLENVPAGTVINAWIDSRDLVLNPGSGNYGKRYYTAVVDENGEYTLVVDAGVKNVTVTIEPQAFTAEQTTENGSKSNVLFTYSGSLVVDAYNQKTQIRNLTYSYQAAPKAGVATIKGEALYRHDICTNNPDSQYAPVPNGTLLVATWTDENGQAREEMVTVQNGKYQLAITTVSRNINITLRGLKFYATRKERNSNNDCIQASDYAYTHNTAVFTLTKGETLTASDVLFN